LSTQYQIFEFKLDVFQVFDVMLNAEHIVVERLDIFGKVGRGTGHDEIIPLKVKDGKLYVKGESSDLYYNKISVEFIKV